MPTDSISQTLKESYAQADSADVYLETIEVFQDSGGTAPFTGTEVGSTDLFVITEDFESGGDPLLDTGTLPI